MRNVCGAVSIVRARRGPESSQAPVHRHEAQRRLGDGHHLHSHVARVALSGRRHGFVLTPDLVGSAAQPTIHRELVLNAVLMAVRRRRPRGTLIHSDQAPSSAAPRGAASVVRIISNQV